MHSEDKLAAFTYAVAAPAHALPAWPLHVQLKVLSCGHHTACASLVLREAWPHKFSPAEDKQSLAVCRGKLKDYV